MVAMEMQVDVQETLVQSMSSVLKEDWMSGGMRVQFNSMWLMPNMKHYSFFLNHGTGSKE